MRVIVTLNRAVVGDPKAAERAWMALAAAGLRLTTERRTLDLLGFAGGEIDESDLPALRELDEVESVDIDRPRLTL